MAKERWYATGLSFSCTQCGNCCGGAPGYVWVTKEDIARIAKYLGRPGGSLDETEVRRVGLRRSLTERANGDCVFLVREGGKTRCSVYPVRPLQCQTWPFWSGNLKSQDAWNEAHVKCPGINNGRQYAFVEIEQIRLRKL